MTDSPFQIAFGTAPVNWNNFDLPGWRPVVPFPAILEEMVQAGYSRTEWDASFGDDSAALNDDAARRGMKYVAAYRWFDFLDQSKFKEQLANLPNLIRTLTEIGATDLIVADALRPDRVAIVGSVPTDGSRSLDKDDVDRLATNVHHLARVVQHHGLALRYHNHTGTWIESPSEVESLTARLDLDLTSLCFDTGHYAYGGGDSRRFLETHGDAVGLIHLKDVDPGILTKARSNQWSFLESLRNIVFCPLGEGSAEVADIVRHLVRRRFAGHVIIEQDTCAGSSTEVAKRNLTTALAFAAEVSAIERAKTTS